LVGVEVVEASPSKMIPRASGRANAMAKRLAWMKSFGEWWRLDWRIGLSAKRHLKAVETPGDRRQIVDRPARLADGSYGVGVGAGVPLLGVSLLVVPELAPVDGVELVVAVGCAAELELDQLEFGGAD
jgi:hypothetical protein